MTCAAQRQHDQRLLHSASAPFDFQDANWTHKACLLRRQHLGLCIKIHSKDLSGQKQYKEERDDSPPQHNTHQMTEAI
jgi:hypothetical protein